MPNTVSFQVGTAYTKKRKRMTGTNNVKKAEIKQWNPRYPDEGDTYNGVRFINLLSSTFNTVVNSSSWLPQRLYMPTLGAGSYQRIGKRIFLKYLRFKGYIKVYARMVIGARWRLRLLRCDNFLFTSPSTQQNAQKATIEYLTMLKNNESYPLGDASWSNAQSMRTISAHNFYKSVKNVTDSNIIHSKVIASGYLPVAISSTHQTIEGSLTGNAAGALVLSSNLRYNDIDDGVYNIPIDVKVKCNDYVDGDDVRYYIVLETDTGCGISDSATSLPVFSLSAAATLFELSFFIRGYYTDC